MSKCELDIEYAHNVVKITNRSENHRIIVYLKPLSPKRKWPEAFLIEPQTFLIFDGLFELERYAYMFEEVKT